LEAHNRAFRFCSGVPKKIRYDNGKTAVALVTVYRTRKITRESQRLQSHRLFEPQFCLVRRANEKGHVERLLDFVRENYLVPMP
jgi:transposase